ncbi:MAG: serine hydrolase [Lachnospiraceae bacterium]|nr:serine hydrolase [Lachnospiraceae bacterium]
MSNTIFAQYPPVRAGIPADAIHRFLDRLENYQVNMHSFLLMRHGLLVAEGYYAPYRADTLHRMFSVCKTMNALAVGLLCEEGRLSLDDTVIRYFPDKVPDNVHPFIAEMTIRNLLMMRTCHASTTYKHDPAKEWVESFFTTPPTHKPGTVFHYDTSAAHVLCVLVERLTGMPMLDYLKDRVLSKIGWSKHSYVLKNDFGDSQGGSGLMATPMDLLLLGKLLMQNGSWEGEQLLPKEFVAEMTSLLTPNTLTGGVLSEAQGYGYQLWRTRHEGFVCYGMGGQLAVCLPKQDMILVTTADTQGCGGGNDLIYNSFYEEILPVLDTCSDDKAEEAAAASLRTRLAKLSLTPLKDWCRAASDKPLNHSFLEDYSCASKINGKNFSLAPNNSGFSDISLSLTKTEGCLNYTFKGRACKIPFGLNACIPGTFPLYDISCAASGMWLSENTFYIKVHLLDTFIGSVHMEFVFGEDDVTIFMKKIEETQFKEFAGHFYGTGN